MSLNFWLLPRDHQRMGQQIHTQGKQEQKSSNKRLQIFHLQLKFLCGHSKPRIFPPPFLAYKCTGARYPASRELRHGQVAAVRCSAWGLYWSTGNHSSAFQQDSRHCLSSPSSHPETQELGLEHKGPMQCNLSSRFPSPMEVVLWFISTSLRSIKETSTRHTMVVGQAVSICKLYDLCWFGIFHRRTSGIEMLTTKSAHSTGKSDDWAKSFQSLMLSFFCFWFSKLKIWSLVLLTGHLRPAQ